MPIRLMIKPGSFECLELQGEPMNEISPPIAAPDERPFSELKQVTVRADGEISQVNALLADGWRLVKIGHLSDATVYIVGKAEEKKRARAGFLTTD